MKRRRKAKMAIPDLSRAGIYSIPDAAALIGVSVQKVRAWVEGRPRSEMKPLIDNDIGWLENRIAISFANLMELRFVAFFTDAGVRFPEIRRIMNEVRTFIRRPHPFATDIVFRTDGERIVAEAARRNGIPSIYDLRSNTNRRVSRLVRFCWKPAGDGRDKPTCGCVAWAEKKGL